MSKAENVDLRSFSRDDLIELNRRIHFELDQQSREIKAGFSVNDPVKFESRQGMIEGKISKINKKNIKVDAGIQGMWDVSPSLLERND